MKKVKVYLLMLSVVLLSACTLGVKEEVEEGTVTDNGKVIGGLEAPVKKGETYTAKEGVYAEGGQRYDLDITVTDVIRGEEAWELIKKENSFNEMPLDGYEYVLVKVKGKALDDSGFNTSDYFLAYSNFEFVDVQGEIYEMKMVVNPDELAYRIGHDEEAEGYISGHVKKGEKALVKFSPVDLKSYYFEIE